MVAQAFGLLLRFHHGLSRRRGGVAEPLGCYSRGAAAIPLYAPLVALLAIGYDQLSAWATMLVLRAGARRSAALHPLPGAAPLTEGLTRANEQLERANLSFAAALVATLDARDQYTAGHSAAVAVYSRDIAERMGLDEERSAEAHLCGLVHDIGKIGLPPAS